MFSPCGQGLKREPQVMLLLVQRLFILPCWGCSDEYLYTAKPSRSWTAHPFTATASTHLRFNVPGSFAWQQLNLQGTHSCQAGGREQIRSNRCEPCNVASSLSSRRSNPALAQCFRTPFGADLSASGKGWSSSCCVHGKTGFSAEHETGFIKHPLWLTRALTKRAYKERLESLHL